MRVLLLEDNAARTAQFIERFIEGKYNYTIVATSSEAINLLKQNEYDLIFLDHDLGGEVYSTAEDCGMRVAEHLSENPNTGLVIVHSLNTNAAVEMINKINIEPGKIRAIYVPYAWNKDSFPAIAQG